MISETEYSAPDVPDGVYCPECHQPLDQFLECRSCKWEEEMNSAMEERERMNWKVISWASKHYWDEQDKLAASIREFSNIDCYLVRDARQPSWKEATQYKPTFLYSHMVHMPQEDALVWVDSDATIERYPEIFDTLDEDIAFVNFRGNGRDEYLTGTLWLKNNEKVRKFLKLWISIQVSDYEERHQLREQACFKKAVQDSPDLVIALLPLSYTSIYDHPTSPKDPHITHWQASRRLRR